MAYARAGSRMLSQELRLAPLFWLMKVTEPRTPRRALWRHGWCGMRLKRRDWSLRVCHAVQAWKRDSNF